MQTQPEVCKPCLQGCETASLRACTTFPVKGLGRSTLPCLRYCRPCRRPHQDVLCSCCQGLQEVPQAASLSQTDAACRPRRPALLKRLHASPCAAQSKAGRQQTTTSELRGPRSPSTATLNTMQRGKEHYPAACLNDSQLVRVLQPQRQTTWSWHPNAHIWPTQRAVCKMELAFVHVNMYFKCSLPHCALNLEAFRRHHFASAARSKPWPRIFDAFSLGGSVDISLTEAPTYEAEKRQQQSKNPAVDAAWLQLRLRWPRPNQCCRLEVNNYVSCLHTSHVNRMNG